VAQPTSDVDDEEQRLIDKLRKIEALFARPATAGEKSAAASARERIRERLRALERTERPIEYRFGMTDGWSKALFIALLRRYDLKPFRYRGQRRTTVMVRVTETFVNEVLWPEFQQLNATLRTHLEAVTQRIVAQAIHGAEGEIEERPPEKGQPGEVGGQLEMP
jgi:hypothetical protein